MDHVTETDLSGRYHFGYTTEEEEDGRWTVFLNVIPWCVTFGDTKEEAVAELHDAAHVVVEYLESTGQSVPIDDQRLTVK